MSVLTEHLEKAKENTIVHEAKMYLDAAIAEAGRTEKENKKWRKALRQIVKIDTYYPKSVATQMKKIAEKALQSEEAK